MEFWSTDLKMVDGKDHNWKDRKKRDHDDDNDNKNRNRNTNIIDIDIDIDVRKTHARKKIRKKR